MVMANASTVLLNEKGEKSNCYEETFPGDRLFSLLWGFLHLPLKHLVLVTVGDRIMD